MAKRVRKSNKPGFEWDVQPFQFVKDLEANYLQTVMHATQARSETIADEATRWMKQHAPWQDQTTAARAGVRAYVMRGQEDTAAERSGLAEAQEIDKQLLAERRRAVRERKEAVQQRIKDLRAGYGMKVTRFGLVTYGRAPDPKAADRLQAKIGRQRQYKLPRRLPKSVSAVEAFKAGEAGRKTPIVAVKFTHNTDLPYVIWLEIANQGKYAIISRAIAHFRPVLFGEIKKIATLKQYRDKFQLPVYKTDAERFQEHVLGFEKLEGREYEAWSPVRRERRAVRRKRYDSEREKAYRAELAELKQQREGPKTRKVTYEEPARFSDIPGRVRRR